VNQIPRTDREPSVDVSSTSIHVEITDGSTLAPWSCSAVAIDAMARCRLDHEVTALWSITDGMVAESWAMAGIDPLGDDLRNGRGQTP